MKIVFITESLVPHGGTEKILTEKLGLLMKNENTRKSFSAAAI